MNQKPRLHKENLLAQLARGEIDPPDRYSSSAFGEKKVSHCSSLAKHIKQATTEEELTSTLRGRSPCAAEQDLAIRQMQTIRARGIAANRSIVLKFEWTPHLPESAHVAALCILEWRSRYLKDIERKFNVPMDRIKNDFVAIPEIWSKEGDPVPLHYHVMMFVPNKALQWFGQTAHKRWMQVIDRFGLRGRIHLESVTSQRQLSTYNMKQADIDWVAQHILLPIDVEKYRNG